MNISVILKFKGLASGLIGGILMFLGVVGFFVGDEFLGVRNFYNWFYVANSFIFFGIFCFVMRLNCKKDEKEAQG